MFFIIIIIQQIHIQLIKSDSQDIYDVTIDFLLKE